MINNNVYLNIGSLFHYYIITIFYEYNFLFKLFWRYHKIQVYYFHAFDSFLNIFCCKMLYYRIEQNATGKK